MRTRRYGQADLFVFEHDHNFHQLFGKLTGQQGLKGICHFAVLAATVDQWDTDVWLLNTS